MLILSKTERFKVWTVCSDHREIGTKRFGFSGTLLRRDSTFPLVSIGAIAPYRKKKKKAWSDCAHTRMTMINC